MTPPAHLRRRTHAVGVGVYLLLIAAVAGALWAAWPSGGLADATGARQAGVALLLATLLAALLIGVPGLIAGATRGASTRSRAFSPRWPVTPAARRTTATS
mgnify:CR=1 FL=1